MGWQVKCTKVPAKPKSKEKRAQRIHSGRVESKAELYFVRKTGRKW